MLKLRVVPLLLALTAAACHDGPTAIPSTPVRASKVSDGIRIENLTDKGMGYFVVDEDALALLDWAPCTTTASNCLRLPAHRSVTVKFADIYQYSASTKTVVAMTWSVVDDGHGNLYADHNPAAVVKLD